MRSISHTELPSQLVEKFPYLPCFFLGQTIHQDKYISKPWSDGWNRHKMNNWHLFYIFALIDTQIFNILHSYCLWLNQQWWSFTQVNKKPFTSRKSLYQLEIPTITDRGTPRVLENRSGMMVKVSRGWISGIVRCFGRFFFPLSVEEFEQS